MTVPSSSSPPLAGVRIVDFSWVGAGPITTKLLAAFGAEVIRIESSTRPDITRLAPPYKDGVAGVNRSGYYNNRNPGKRSIVLDMRRPEARDIVVRLIRKSDVVIHNFTLGTMEKWDLGYEAVKRLRADIVYVAMLLHGSTGPHRDYMGFGSTMNALVGLNYLTAPSGGEPRGVGTNYPDHVPNPAHAVFGIVAALRHRKRTGEGQYVEVTQTETALNIVAVALMDYANNGVVQQPQGNHRPGAAPHGVYATRMPRTWVAIDVRSDEEWARLGEALGRPAWADDARFDTMEGRLRHRDELDQLLEETTSGLDRDDLCDRLSRHRIRAAAVANGRDAVMDPQLNARRHWVYLDHPEVGYTLYDDTPIRMSETPPCFTSPAPLLGEHTEAVLKGVLGMSNDEYRRLAESGLFQ